jgi:hypothetical protein
MSANVEITDTFDQWRVKTNEVLVATQTDGSSNFIKLTNTTDSSSTTTGSIISAGGVGIAKKLFVGTDLDVDGTTNLDVVDIDGAVQIDATFTSGVDGQGYDTKFFGDTASAFMIWDTSADDLIFSGGAGLIVPEGQFTLGSTAVTATATEINLIDGDTSRGTTAVASGDGILINDGGTMAMTNVDTVSTYFSSHSVGGGNIVTTGALDTGSITSGFGTIDTGASAITTTGLISGGSLDIDNVLINGTTIGHTDDTDLMTVADAALTLKGTLTVGVDDTGHDVKFFGASAGAFMIYDESADTLEIRGASADATTSSGKLLLSTSLTDINDGDVIGRIDFQTPAETGTDAIVVGATIQAEADATFSATVNSTDLVFLTADSGAATEKLRIDSTGQVTFADGAIDVNIASHDGTNGLKLGGTLVTSTAADLNNAANAATTGKAIAMAIVFG